MSGISSSIQFRGAGPVLIAFEARGVEAWSIWQGKQFMTKGMGSDELSAFIDALQKSGSTAIYTLKVFEDVTDIKKVKSGTDHDGSFNFRLFERDDEAIGGSLSMINPNSLASRFNKFEERMSAFFERYESEETEEEEENVLGTITGLLQDPDKLEKLINLGRSLLGSPQPGYTIGNVQRMPDNNSNSGSASLSPSTQSLVVNPEEKLKRLGEAIDTLEKNDPLLIEHLEKLAKISRDQPRQFLQLTSMLDVI